MNKKLAISLILAGEALIYLFLLVGWPMFTDWLYSFEDVCTEARDFGPTWFFYLIPGLVGVFFIVLILKQKKEVKNG